MALLQIQPGASTLVRPGDILTHPIHAKAFATRVPLEATTKGHFSNVLRNYVKTHRPAALSTYDARYPDKYPAFRDIPVRDNLERSVKIACMTHPDLPAEAMRRMGRAAYGALLDSILGRVLVGPRGVSLMAIYRNGPRGYQLFTKHGTRVHYTKLSDEHFRDEEKDQLLLACEGKLFLLSLREPGRPGPLLNTEIAKH